MLVAAQRAKDDLNSVQRAPREAVGLSQSFVTRGDACGASAFPSQAEMTLTKYSSAGGSRKGGHPINCFGCGGPHPWSEFIDGKRVVKCPNRLNPGVADNATKALEKYRANRKKQFTKNTKKQNFASTNFSDFNKASQQRIRAQVQQAKTSRKTIDTVSVASSVTSPSVHPKTKIPAGHVARVTSSLLTYRFWQLLALSCWQCRSLFKVSCLILSFSLGT